MCSAIEKDGGDVKALYRRSQALEKLGRLDQAVLDLKRCVSLEPKNKVFQESLRNIGGQIQEKVRYMSSTDAKVEQMFQILLDPKEKGTEKKQKVWVLEWATRAPAPTPVLTVWASDGLLACWVVG